MRNLIGEVFDSKSVQFDIQFDAKMEYMYSVDVSIFGNKSFFIFATNSYNWIRFFACPVASGFAIAAVAIVCLSVGPMELYL